MDPDTTKRQGGGKSPTKFLPRPKEEKAEDPEQQGISFEDVDALEDQETPDLGDAPQKEGWPEEPEQPRDPRKAREPKKKDASSGDTGDCAC